MATNRAPRKRILMPGYVTPTEASERLGGFSTQTLKKWADGGKISAIRMPGGQYLYKEADLDINKLITVVGQESAEPVTVQPSAAKKTVPAVHKK